ncbi:MAG TPA: PilZ domain-containing protein [Desulfobacteraceae bacterium]|nr:PilZ domain-containing protein [Desulfobacteraceae bacterium]
MGEVSMGGNIPASCSGEERRRGKRFVIDSIVFPFLGSRDEDHTCFEYLLLDIGLHGVRISVPRWVVNRERLREGDRINLHVPFELEHRSYDQGRVVWASWDKEMDAQVCGIEVTKQMPLYNRVYFSLSSREVTVDLGAFSSVEDLGKRLLKDLFLLKKGVLIYLNHLVAYFSRVGEYPSRDYPRLKEVFLDDIRNRVRDHRDSLEGLYDDFRGEGRPGVAISGFLDLEELRDMVESEISLEILSTTFQKEAAMFYLQAIKDLEKKLYEKYNAVVMLYIKSI